MTLRLTDRVTRIKASPTSAAAERARQLKAEGRPVISLTTGEPDFATPVHIVEAAEQAMWAGATRYTSVGGTGELKDAIREKFRVENGLVFASEEVMASTGAKQIIYNAIQALVETGDEVVIPYPAWVSYVDMVRLADGSPVLVETRAEDGFRLTAMALEKAVTARTRLLLLNSPCNPTGATLTVDDLKSLSEVLRRYPDVTVICDDIYEHIRYVQADFPTLAAVSPDLANRILTVNGVSKAYAMTGWRIGFAGGPSELISAMTRMQSQSTSNPSSVGQAAAVAALTGPKACIEKQCAAFTARRERILPRLNAIEGLEVLSPDGAFYFFVGVKGLLGLRGENGVVIDSEAAFVSNLLEAGNVAVVGGAAFGLSPYFRMSFAASDKDLDEAVNRIETLVNKLG